MDRWLENLIDRNESQKTTLHATLDQFLGTMTTTNMASYTFPLDIIVITDTSLLKEKASKSIFSQFLNLFTLSGTRYSWCLNIINYGPYMHNEWARTAGTTSEEGGTRKPSWASQVPPPLLFLDQTEAQRQKKFFGETSSPSPYLRFWMTGPPPGSGSVSGFVYWSCAQLA